MNTALEMALEISKTQDMLWALKQIPAKQLAMEAKLNKKLKTLFARVAAEATRQLKEIGITPSGDLHYKKVVAPLENASREFAKTLGDGAVEAGQYGRNRTVSQLRLPITELPTHAANLLRDKSFVASQRTLQRMVGDVVGNLATSHEEGLGIKDAAERLASEFDGMQKYELRRVARTEIVTAQNLATEQTEIELGVEYHQWWTAQDDRVRDNEVSHVEMHGQIVRVGERFSNGLEYPGDRDGPIEEWINCRCHPVPFLMPWGKRVPTGLTYFYETDLVEA